jgi:acyl-CoA thioesterase
LREIADFMLKNDKVASWLNVELLDFRKGYSRVRMTVRHDMLNAADVCQGGAIFSLADFSFALASNSYGKLALAVNASIDFLNPAFEGDELTAEAVEVSRGGRMATYMVEVKNQDKVPVAIFTGQVFIKDKAI